MVDLGVVRASDTDDLAVRRWETGTGELRETLATEGKPFHEGAVVSGEISEDSRELLTASVDGTARLWDTTSGELLFLLGTWKVCDASRNAADDQKRRNPRGDRLF